MAQLKTRDVYGTSPFWGIALFGKPSTIVMRSLVNALGTFSPLVLIEEVMIDGSRLSTDDRVALGRALRLLEVFRSIDPRMAVEAATGFIQIVLDNGTTMAAVSKRMGIGPSLASHYFQYLGKIDRHRKLGLDLIDDCINPPDRREKILKPTPRGELLISQLVNMLKR